jgi:hypothetical protein
MSTPTRASNARRTAFALALAFPLLVGTAQAQGQGKASAEELFQLGKGAMGRQEYTKACGLFQASLDAEFALGTLLNLAMCHEQAGKIASAWAEFRVLEDKARAATPPQPDRAQFAQERAEALRPKLSRLRITLAPETRALAGLKVTIDGVAIAPELFDVGTPVDIGKRRVAAVAPDRAEWSQTVAVDDDKLRLDVRIPPLAPAPAPSAKPAATVDLAQADRLMAHSSQRVVGLAAGGIGVASLVTGAVFGFLALGASNDARCAAPCLPGQSGTYDAAESAYHRGSAFAWVSNVAIGAGLIGIAVGAYLVLTATPAAPRGSPPPEGRP